MTEAELAGLRESMVHGLRMKGWSRIDAENEADDRVEILRARDRDGAEGGDANAAPVPQDRQARADRHRPSSGTPIAAAIPSTTALAADGAERGTTDGS